jgi:hypothetical protein
MTSLAIEHTLLGTPEILLILPLFLLVIAVFVLLEAVKKLSRVKFEKAIDNTAMRYGQIS